MYQPLSACAGCRRHFRSSEERCPFCDCLGDRTLTRAVSGEPARRMSRAAMVVAAMAITACSTEPAPIAKDPAAVKPSPTPSQPVVQADAGLVDDPGSPVAEYGAPAPPPPPKPKPSVGSGIGAPAPMYGMPPHIK